MASRPRSAGTVRRPGNEIKAADRFNLDGLRERLEAVEGTREPVKWWQTLVVLMTVAAVAWFGGTFASMYSDRAASKQHSDDLMLLKEARDRELNEVHAQLHDLRNCNCPAH
jgi:hypothetical protein